MKKLGYRLESEMMNPVTDALPIVLGIWGEALSVLRTPSIGNIIPDILFAKWQEGASCVRGTLTTGEASVIAALECGKTLTAATMPEKLFVSKMSAEKYVNKLSKLGGLRTEASGQYRLTHPVRTDYCEIIAVEVKMSRWREALEQAITYQTFADESYVVLDSTQTKFSEELFRSFESANVGLLVQSRTELRRIIRCTSRRQFSTARVIACQKLKRSGGTTKPLNTPSIFEMQIAKSSDDPHLYALYPHPVS